MDFLCGLIEVLGYFGVGVRKLLGLAPKKQSRMEQAGEVVLAILVILVIVFATIGGLVWLLTPGA